MSLIRNKNLRDAAAKHKASRNPRKRLRAKKQIPQLETTMCGSCGEGLDGGKCDYLEGHPRCKACFNLMGKGLLN